MLALFLASPPAITLDNHPLTFTTRHGLALLIYLSLQPGTHTRAYLAALLWPHLEPDYAKASLRVALSHLRRQLGAYLITTRQTVALNPDQPIQLHNPGTPMTFSLNHTFDAWLTQKISTL